MIGDEIRTKREQLGLSQDDLARAVGTTQQTIQRIESNKTERSSFIPKIIEHLKLPYDVKPPLEERILPKIRREVVRSEHRYFYPLNWGDFEKVIRHRRQSVDKSSSTTDTRTGQLPVLELSGLPYEHTFLSKVPVDYIERGDPLMYATGAYSIKIALDEMYPALKAGEIALVNPSLSPLVDEPHLFLSDETDDPVANVVVGYLVKSSSDIWLIRKFNPLSEFEISREQYPLCHRIVGKFTRR